MGRQSGISADVLAEYLRSLPEGSYVDATFAGDALMVYGRDDRFLGSVDLGTGEIVPASDLKSPDSSRSPVDSPAAAE